MNFLDQERQSISRADLPAQLVDVGIKLTTIGIFPAIHESPRTRRIVEIEH